MGLVFLTHLNELGFVPTDSREKEEAGRPSSPSSSQHPFRRDVGKRSKRRVPNFCLCRMYSLYSHGHGLASVGGVCVCARQAGGIL